MIAVGQRRGEETDRGPVPAQVLLLAALLLAAVAIRLWFGMRLPLDADEATTAYAAFGVGHGHYPLTESDVHYLGALEAYWLAPFVLALGPSLLAVRLGMALMGGVYVLAMYGLGRTLLKRERHALLLAGVAAIFPVFALSWAMKARSGYAELLVFEAVLFLVATRLGWSATRLRRRSWFAFGLLGGVAMWNDLLILVPLLAICLALAVRSGAAHRRIPQLAVAGLGGALLGFSPWLLDQLQNSWRGLQDLPDYSTSAGAALAGLAARELPIFLGASGTCSRSLLPAAAAWLLFGFIVAATIWLRREQLAPLLSGRLDRLQPIEMVLAAAPAALLSVTIGRFNATPCEPRYLLPLAVPLALAGALVLMNAGRLWTGPAVIAAASYLALAAVYLSGPTVDSHVRTASGIQVSDDPVATAATLRRHHVRVVFADYWLARPIQFAGAGRLVVGVYAGPAGFPEEQHEANGAAHPSYLFMEGDPGIGALEAEMRARGVLAERVVFAHHVLFVNLSAPILPADLGLPAPLD